MIKINSKDTIIDIIVKINHCKDKKIVLDFPFGHPILHNYISLKILKNNFKKKDLVIITSDKTAKKLWAKLWIKYSLVKNEDIIEHNYNFFEYWTFLIKKYKNEFINFIFWIKKIKFHKDNNTDKSNNKKSMIWFFIIWLIISLLLLLFIFYFAVNKTYIYIKPDILIKSRAKNLYFLDIKENPSINEDNLIKLKKIEKIINIKDVFWTSWIDEKKINKARWQVIFYNELFEQIKLLSNTRLETKEWILFESDSSIIIPAASKNSSWSLIPWKIKINITSKTHDSNWKFMWINANIKKDTLLNLPWLKENRDKIYAITYNDINGWNDNLSKIVLEEDIINWKKILETKLKQKSLKELKKQISVENKTNNITYDILNISEIIKYSDLEIIWDENINLWDHLDNFELQWKIKLTSYIYNKDLVLSKLQKTINESMLWSVEKLLFIDIDSFRIANIMNIEEEPLSIKATTQVEVHISHNFLYEESNFLEKIKYTITWYKKEDALNLLLNNQKISNVKIETRPFFMKNISKLPKNIIFKIMDK